ncbi:hypothetical protein SAMN05443287_10910 [Micromonospora phaseoli]|uniref:Uncharacterized protein n=1 Tax=Micromonospora phaseoli TaxID=1144548 RepID=A0A1H7C9G7_9ACTN|nr:hypothetical protein [Micromonospora phaseoli]PZV97976.1 hypothetical protein CLV64_105244 [Micromonospora phaseoli]GIJ81214.1 hypothetical protein Xph01_56460 [Micromonospora phaseoli]SEJ86513.1 hypothetical protein SAMN05443287_10910 [Micromonospora phaseoli]
MSRTISKKHLLAGLAAAGVLGVGIAAPTVALADDKTTPSASASAEEQQGGRADGERPGRGAEFAEALAEELGVPTDKVTEALAKLRERHQPQGRTDGERHPGFMGHGDGTAEGRKGGEGERRTAPSVEERTEALAERLAQAVEDGKLTQEQADAITAAVEAGVLGGWGGPGVRGGEGQSAGS